VVILNHVVQYVTRGDGTQGEAERAFRHSIAVRVVVGFIDSYKPGRPPWIRVTRGVCPPDFLNSHSGCFRASQP
jgi:hypothetical protein